MKKVFNGKWITKLDYTGLTNGLFDLAPRWVHISCLGNAPLCEIAAKEIEASPAQYPWEHYANGFFDYIPNFRSDNALISAALAEYWLPSINPQTGDFCPFKARELGELMAGKFFAWQAIIKDVSHFDNLILGYTPPPPKECVYTHRAGAFALVIAYDAGLIPKHIFEDNKVQLKEFISNKLKGTPAEKNPQNTYNETLLIKKRLANASKEYPDDYDLGLTLYNKYFK